MIFVTVGVRKYPFNRLFKELDELVERGIIKEEIFAQIGTSTYKPKNYQFVEYISQEEFQRKIDLSDIVISHGASGSIMRALNSKKKVIAVTRLHEHGEHIDNHQISINKAFGNNGYVAPVINLSELSEVYQKLIANEIKLKPWSNNEPMMLVNEIDAFIQQTWNTDKFRRR